mmetsp:Transcript_21123/g.41869  ORF Transcript_21123/g.41869 Transcript_21123/m.41869 type:complete len:393 (-) Transcript_21123:233-1411(-)
MPAVGDSTRVFSLLVIILGAIYSASFLSVASAARVFSLLIMSLGAIYSISFLCVASALFVRPTRMQWSPATQLLEEDPANLSIVRDDVPRFAKDANYAREVQKAWKFEVDRRPAPKWEASGSPIVYSTEAGIHLYGYFVRSESPYVKKGNLPGVLLFHTGAGPQDIFLRWKAESLATNVEIGGCVVMVCDILSDGEGWTWDDKERYAQARKETLSSFTDDNGSASRPELQRRIQAAVNALSDLEGVDSGRLAAMGWCMGGHPILEIARMDINGMHAAVTFHGVFDSLGEQGVSYNVGALGEGEEIHGPRSALICHGSRDPFVKANELDACRHTFENCDWEWELLSFDTAKHGFTNPAQDFNPSENFAFNKDAASKSWEAACLLLKQKLVEGN